MLNQKNMGFKETNITGWWFQPLWKILVSWDDYSQYMEKSSKCSKPPTSSMWLSYMTIQWIGLRGKVQETPYFMGKSLVSCIFSSQSIELCHCITIYMCGKPNHKPCPHSAFGGMFTPVMVAFLLGCPNNIMYNYIYTVCIYIIYNYI